jgi:hypothetical protein
MRIGLKHMLDGGDARKCFGRSPHVKKVSEMLQPEVEDQCTLFSKVASFLTCHF